MIRPAIIYKKELQEKMAETWYDPEYEGYYDVNPGIPDIPDKPDNQYQFVSISEDGELLGFFSYWVYEPVQRAMNFGLMAFKKNNRTFMKDCEQMFRDIFEKYGLSSMEWRCYATNKNALKLYRHIIKKYGGVEVGTLRWSGCNQRRMICDTVIFEVTRYDLHWDYDNWKILTNEEYDKRVKELEEVLSY